MVAKEHCLGEQDHSLSDPEHRVLLQDLRVSSMQHCKFGRAVAVFDRDDDVFPSRLRVFHRDHCKSCRDDDEFSSKQSLLLCTPGVVAEYDYRFWRKP